MLILEECKRSNTRSNSLWDRSLEHKILFKKKKKKLPFEWTFIFAVAFFKPSALPQTACVAVLVLSTPLDQVQIDVNSLIHHAFSRCLFESYRGGMGGQIHSLRFVGIFCQFSSSFVCKSKKKCLGKLFQVFQSC